MGYFSNGTEGMMYEEQYCSRCVHQDADGAGCPVWNLHLDYSYELCNDKQHPGKVMLDTLIPPDKQHPAFNGQCAMFHASAADDDLFEEPAHD